MWPENWSTFSFFCALETQWLIGPMGRSGLLYLVVFEMLDRAGYTGNDWQAMFDDVRAMERAALKAMNPPA